jgi:WD40 repeat protein
LRVNELSHLFEHMHASPITACAISDDGSHIVTGAVDGGIAIWEHLKGANSTRTLTLKKRMFGHVGIVTCIRICSLHGIVVSGSVDCSVVVWNVRTGHRLFCVLNIPSTITAFDVGSSMGMIWIVAGKSLFITTINGHPLLDMFCSIAITSIAVGPAPEWHDNNCFVTGHEDGSLRFWKLRHEQAFNKPESPSDNGTVVFQRGRCFCDDRSHCTITAGLQRLR